MKTYIKLLAAIALGASFAACNDDFERPPMVLPEATDSANTTIADLKAMYWQSENNYNSLIAAKSNGDDVIISGIVVSSDQANSVYKSVYLQDSTAAITIAINSSELYKSYQFGQKITVKCNGLYAGRYAGLMQLGAPDGTKMTFMDKTLFANNTQISGLPNAANVKPAVRTISQLLSYASNPDSLMLYQSRLVKIDSVQFVNAGQQFAPTDNTDRYIKDADGNRINVRCSNRCAFKDSVIPAGTGCVTALLGYFNTLQLTLIDLDGLEGFTKAEPINPGGVCTYKKATAVESGKQYAIVYNNLAAKPFSKDHDYLYTSTVNLEADGSFKADANLAFTFTSETGGYSIMADGNYYFMKDGYTSFNISPTLPSEGGVWTVTANADGTFIIKNVDHSMSIQYSTSYTSFGSYPNKRGEYPSLYEIVK